MANRPRSVLLAAMALVFAIAVQVALIVYYAYFVGASLQAGWAQFVFAAAVFSLLLWGILGGYRLGWLWGRHLTVFLGTLVVITAFMKWRTGTMPRLALGILLGGLVAPMFLAAWALGRSDALSFFGLICPICRTEVKRGADLFFKKARCPKCNHVW
jgi:hypothetical protein